MLSRAFGPHRYTHDDDLHVFGQAHQRALGPGIRCLVWNILKARRRAWAADFSYLIQDRDLVVLQEAVINTHRDGLFTDSTRFEWVMARSFRHRRTEVETGVKTGAIAPAIERHFYLSPHPEPVFNTQKLLLVTRYPLVGESDTLLVLNMHAVNFVGVRKYVEQLDQLGNAIGGHSGPVILAGDFNTWNPRRLGLFLSICQDVGLEEAAFVRKARLAQFNQHLDHVFFRGLQLQTIDSLSHIQSSDHAPITVCFRRQPLAPGRIE